LSTSRLQGQYTLVIEALRLLAAPFDQQKNALPPFVVRADEVALTFGNAFDVAEQVHRAGLISVATYTRLEGIHAELARMSEPEHTDLWTDEALQYGREWNALRATAADALAAEQLPLEPVSLSLAIYVPGSSPATNSTQIPSAVDCMSTRPQAPDHGFSI
jgi:hypothetical protein